MPSVSVVIPAFNSETTLPILVNQLLISLCGQKFELIIVDDGSTDKSWEVIKNLSLKHDEIKGLRLIRNSGQHAALLAGIRSARYEVTVTMDDDLQHPPEEISRLVSCLDIDTDLVYGSPDSSTQGLTRTMTSRFAKLTIEKMLSVEDFKHVSAFRAFKTKLRDAFDARLGPAISIDAILSWSTTRIRSIRVRHNPRISGESGYTVRKLFRYVLDVATGYSTVPLRFATGLGLLTIALSIGVVVYVTVRSLMSGESVPGFPFLASTIAIFSGTQLLVLGILGQYIGRMHFRVMNKPTYTITESTSQLPE